MQGYTLPCSPTGRSALVPPPPWHFSGDVLMVEYRADQDAVQAFLPPGAEADPDGRAAAIFGTWQSWTDAGREYVDPIRSQYHEFYIALACTLGGDRLARVPFCYVDADFSLVRGLIQGYPKKLASIAMTRPTTVGGGPRLAPGSAFGASAAASHRRLADMVVTLEGRGDEVPELMQAPLLHTRRFPSWDESVEGISELVVSRSRDQEVSRPWTGRAELRFGESPVDELAALAPLDVGTGFWFSFAETLVGGRLVDGVMVQAPA